MVVTQTLLHAWQVRACAETLRGLSENESQVALRNALGVCAGPALHSARGGLALQVVSVMKSVRGGKEGLTTSVESDPTVTTATDLSIPACMHNIHHTPTLYF